ncbi:MAG TPA: hypothetical protein VEH29_17740, partial [Acidimicrobiales bacterium]|nr:hypothetical protein [Acidimicrobiales bacterium]
MQAYDVDEVVDEDADFFFFLATVVVVVDEVDVVAGSVVVTTPAGSSRRNVLMAATSAAGGRGIVVPFGMKAIVISSPFSRRMPSAAEAGTTVPFVEAGDFHVSTTVSPGLEPLHFVTPSLKSRVGPGLVSTVVVV